jgi:hypothetical protein
MTAAEELRQAAFQLRNPFHRLGRRFAVDPEVGDPLADLLDTAAEYAVDDSPNPPAHLVRALAVARAINTQEPT